MKIQNKIMWLLLLITISNNYIYSKKLIQNHGSFELLKNKDWFNAHSWFKIVPLQQILNQNLQIIYKKVVDPISFAASEFSLSLKFPHKGSFDELFVLSIPYGKVQGLCGHVFIDNKLPEEMARANRFDTLFFVPKLNNNNFQKISGRVAVIAQHGVGQICTNYYHALCEICGRLAILEMSGIEYDWLYIPIDKKFIKEILELWGIDFSKIISPSNEYFAIQADELIVPSLVINTDVGHKHAGNFQHPVTLQYVRNKLLSNAKNKKIDTSDFSKKIFISRKDSYAARKILNEDELFKLFEVKGFKRYELTKMSVAEQIMLFEQAEIVISEQGSGLTNILFCGPNTMIIEIFQVMIDNCFWWISHVFDLKYFPIKTLDIDVDYFANWWEKGIQRLAECRLSIVNVPLDEIEKFIKTIESVS